MSGNGASVGRPILLGPSEVCTALGVSLTVLYRKLRKDPSFPPAVYIGDRPKWRVKALEKWAASREGKGR